MLPNALEACSLVHSASSAENVSWFCQIIACYRANNHPCVRRGEKASAAVQQDFLHTLSNITSTDLHNSHGMMVSFPAFLDFYCSLTAFTSDTDFRCEVPPDEVALFPRSAGCISFWQFQYGYSSEAARGRLPFKVLSHGSNAISKPTRSRLDQAASETVTWERPRPAR